MFHFYKEVIFIFNTKDKMFTNLVDKITYIQNNIISKFDPRTNCLRFLVLFMKH